MHSFALYCAAIQWILVQREGSAIRLWPRAICDAIHLLKAACCQKPKHLKAGRGQSSQNENWPAHCKQAKTALTERVKKVQATIDIRSARAKVKAAEKTKHRALKSAQTAIKN